MWFADFQVSGDIMGTFSPPKESCDVVPEGKTDSQRETRRLSLQGMRRRIEEKEEAVLAEEGQRVTAVGAASLFFFL
jgi:hypothetical protein